jgi:DNA-binding GntR family transcriptional regulator
MAVTDVEKQPVDAIPSMIAAKLRTLIASGHYSPGIRLGQTELADQFSASRVPVREALKLLSAEGAVEHDPNRGFFVARFSRSEAHQYFRLRDMVEDELLKSIRWPSDAEIDDFRARAEELEKLLNEGNRADWWALHQAFHHALFDLSPNKILVREAMRYWSLTDRYRTLVPLPRRPSAARNIVNKADLVEALSKQNLKKLLKVRSNRRKAFEEAVLSVLEERGL